MDTEVLSKEKGLAPIVGWSNDSPSLSPALGNTPNTQVPVRSNSYGSLKWSDQHSPDMSSVGREPPVLPLTPPEENDKLALVPAKNGDIPSIKENPINDYCVKFLDDVDGKVISDDDDDDSICSSSDEGDNGKEKLKIPDGGWGWVVVLSSFLISMVADGISFTFGLLYIEFLNHFEESKSATAWIGSLFMAVPLLAGPVASALVDRYGCRSMTMVGGVISGIGFVLSAFSDSLVLQYLTFGVIAGMGLAFTYVTAVVSVCYWFDKKRTLATGLGACGTGFGCFVYAPMTRYFIDEYGWRGCVLLLSGTFFNMCVCGAVMRDPEWWTEEQNKSNLSKSKVKSSSSCGSLSGRSAGGESNFPGIEEIRKLMKSSEKPEYILTALVTSLNENESPAANGDADKSHENQVAFHSVVNLPTFVRQNETVPLEVLESLSENKKMFKLILQNYPSLLTSRSLSDGSKLNVVYPETVSRVPVPVTMSVKVKPTKKRSPTPPTIPMMDPADLPLLDQNRSSSKSPKLYRKHKESVSSKKAELMRRRSQAQSCGGGFVQPTHYLMNIRVHRNSMMYRGATLNTNRYRLHASSCPDIFRNSMTTIAMENEEKWYDDILEMLKTMVDFSMFLEFHFFLMSFSTILLFIWFIVPYFYISEHMLRHKYTEQDGSNIVSWIGIANFVGMISWGWLGDQKWASRSKVYAAALVLCGVFTLFIPLVTDTYWALVACCLLFGLFFASTYSFTPTILVDLISIQKFTSAYGLMLLCQGIGNLTGPPLAGWFFDVTQSWDLSFYMAGFWIIISGVLVIIIPYTKNRRMIGNAPLAIDTVDQESSASST